MYYFVLIAVILRVPIRCFKKRLFTFICLIRLPYNTAEHRTFLFFLYRDFASRSYYLTKVKSFVPMRYVSCREKRVNLAIRLSTFHMDVTYRARVESRLLINSGWPRVYGARVCLRPSSASFSLRGLYIYAFRRTST